MSKPRVFISYTRSDSSFVDDLASNLKASGIDVWIDKWEIKVGDSITERVYEGIHTSDYLIIVLSKKSVQSKWVREELNSAAFRNIEAEKRAFILPIVIEECDIPASLRHRKYVNFSEDPKAAFQELLESISPDLTNKLQRNCLEALTTGYKLSHHLLLLPVSEKPNREAFQQATEDFKGILTAYINLSKKPDKRKLSELKKLVLELENGTFDAFKAGPERLLGIQRTLFSVAEEIANNSRGKLYDYFYLGHLLGRIGFCVVTGETGDINLQIEQLKLLLKANSLELPKFLKTQLGKLSRKPFESMTYEEIQEIANRIILNLLGSRVYK